MSVTRLSFGGVDFGRASTSEKGDGEGCSTGERTGRVMFPEWRRGRGASAAGDMGDSGRERGGDERGYKGGGGGGGEETVGGGSKHAGDRGRRGLGRGQGQRQAWASAQSQSQADIFSAQAVSDGAYSRYLSAYILVYQAIRTSSTLRLSPSSRISGPPFLLWSPHRLVASVRLASQSFSVVYPPSSTSWNTCAHSLPMGDRLRSSTPEAACLPAERPCVLHYTLHSTHSRLHTQHAGTANQRLSASSGLPPELGRFAQGTVQSTDHGHSAHTQYLHAQYQP